MAALLLLAAVGAAAAETTTAPQTHAAAVETPQTRPHARALTAGNASTAATAIPRSHSAALTKPARDADGGPVDGGPFRATLSLTEGGRVAGFARCEVTWKREPGFLPWMAAEGFGAVACDMPAVEDMPDASGRAEHLRT